METPSEASKPADAKPVKSRPVAPTGRFTLGTASSIKKRADAAPSAAEVGVSRSSLMKSTSSVNASSAPRRSSTGAVGKQQDNGSSAVAKKASPTLSDVAKRTKPVSAPAVSSKPAAEKKASLIERGGADLAKKPAVKASPTSTLKKLQSKTESSNGSSGSTRRVASSASLQSPRSVTSNATKKSGSQTSSALPNRRKSSTADSRDSRFMMLPQVDLKASNEVVSAALLHSLIIQITACFGGFCPLNTFFSCTAETGFKRSSGS